MVTPNKVYLALVKDWYKTHGSTTEQQVDTLLVLFYQTNDDAIFSFIFKLHQKLLTKICKNVFKKYETFLHDEDYGDIDLLVQGEFYRRIGYYEFPSRAPFSKYVKAYIKQWSNVYTKLIVRRNMKTTSFTEFEDFHKADNEV